MSHFITYLINIYSCFAVKRFWNLFGFVDLYRSLQMLTANFKGDVAVTPGILEISELTGHILPLNLSYQ